MTRLAALILLVVLMSAAACGDSSSAETMTPSPDAQASTAEPTDAPADSDGLFPDVVGAEAEAAGDGLWTIRATVSSPYDTPERYADAWRVVAPDGEVLGTRELGHDHAGEQPFTRSLAGVEIPAEITTVTIEGRDQVNGWGGETFALTLPAS